MNIELSGPENDGCGVRLKVTVRFVPEPEAVLAEQFKAMKLVASEPDPPGEQLPTAPSSVKVFVCGL
jgi:hypothetical protein